MSLDALDDFFAAFWPFLGFSGDDCSVRFALLVCPMLHKENWLREALSTLRG